MDKVELFAPSVLGTCWYGKYHYMEPWVGCEHACPYCYARCRQAVNCSLKEHGNCFEQPKLIMPRPQLLETIEKSVNSGAIERLKLCRYTDIFTPSFAADGLSAEIMQILATSKLKRVIITTKGVPSAAALETMAAHPQMFSYSVAVHPAALLQNSPLTRFDEHLQSVAKRLDAAAYLQAHGVLTTVHFDPMVAGIDDNPQALAAMLSELKKRDLKRVMWSYLLLSPGIVATMSQALGEEGWQKMQSDYDLLGARQILPHQDDSISFALREPVFLRSVETIYHALSEGGFECVICSLKNVETLRNLRKYPHAMFCNGKFYA